MKLKNRKISFLGEIIIIIIITITIFLLLRIVNANQIEEIQKINSDFGVDGVNLVPENTNEYIARLSTIKNKEYTIPLIEYSKLNLKEKEINKLIKLTAIKQEKCIPKKLILNLNSFILKQNKILEMFKESKNDKITKTLNWDKYIFILENISEYKDLKYEIESMPICS
jgi:hypothetical protein